MKLFARRGSGSDAVEAALAVCGATCDVEYLEKGADGFLPPGLRRINPRQEVPTLVLDDGTVMTESAAILIWLADRYPAAGLAPMPSSAERPRYLRWMLFLAAAPYASALLYYHPNRYSTDVAAGPGIKAKAIEAMNRDFAILSEGIADGPFILGESMCAADIYAAMLISWADDIPGLFARHANLNALCDRVLAVPAIRRVWLHVEY